PIAKKDVQTDTTQSGEIEIAITVEVCDGYEPGSAEGIVSGWLEGTVAVAEQDTYYIDRILGLALMPEFRAGWKLPSPLPSKRLPPTARSGKLSLLKSP